jgi:hypothetical protein
MSGRTIKKLNFMANVTLMLREEDVDFLLKAVEHFVPSNDDEAHSRMYMLDLLRMLASPTD